MTARLSRQGLFDLVWSEPMRVLGPRFGISDVALKKTCIRAHIPVPEQGHWAKTEARRRKPSLPPRPPGADDEIIVAGGGYHWAYGLSEEEILGPLPNPPAFDEPIESVRERVRKQLGKVTAISPSSTAHPAISRLLAEDDHRREKQRDAAYPMPWNNPVFETPLERRRLKILNSLFLAILKLGCKASIRGENAREISIKVGDQQFYLALDRPKYPKRAMRKTTTSNDDKSLCLSLPVGFDIEDGRLSWQDDEAGRLEDKLTDIAIETIVAGEVILRERRVHSYEWRVKRKAELEEAARQRKAEAERNEIERQRKLEQERVSRLLDQADALLKATTIRAYVESVRAANATAESPLSPNDLNRWCRWACAQADRIDPIKSGAYLKQQVSEDTTQASADLPSEPRITSPGEDSPAEPANGAGHQ